jgi:GT2 family glycosyltransferase
MAQQTPPIAVGIPLWNASAFVAETLQSVLSQRDVRVEVLISVDGGDEKSLAACKPFLGDPRVRHVVQTERLGWVRNSAAVMHADNIDGAAFGCLHLADDLMLDGYLATLRQAAEDAPQAAVIFSDIEAFGDTTEIITQPSVAGPPLLRQIDLLLRHYNAAAWRGLTRIDALHRAGPLESATTNDFAVDTVWMARMANYGDLVRVPIALYRKRYHPANTHTAWAAWSDETKLRCWTEHCAQMLHEALGAATERQSRRLLYDAARVRLLQTESRVGPYSDLIEKSGAEIHKRMLRDFNAALGRLGISARRSFYPLAGAM